jgi:hypothetical protein
LLALWVVLLAATIGVRRRAVTTTTRGSSTSALATSSTASVRAAQKECVLFGLFNYLTLFLYREALDFFMALNFDLPTYPDIYL